MAWNNDRHRVLAHRLADVARVWAAERPRQLTIGRSLTPTDAAQRLIELLLEIAEPRQVDGDVREVHLLTDEIALQISDHGRDLGRRLSRAATAALANTGRSGG